MYIVGHWLGMANYEHQVDDAWVLVILFATNLPENHGKYAIGP